MARGPGPEMEPNKTNPEQRKRAIVSALVLAALVVGIYATFMLKFFARAGS